MLLAFALGIVVGAFLLAVSLLALGSRDVRAHEEAQALARDAER